MKRAAAVLLVVAMLAAVQGAPENDEASTVKESECYDCHKAGGEGSGPVIQEVFRLFMAEAPDTTLGASTALTFDIRNWWTAEMSGFTGTINIAGAPAFSFEPAQPPINSSVEGELPAYLPAAYFQSNDRSSRVLMDVEAGGTDMEMVVTPELSSTDIKVRVWEPGLDPNRDAPTYDTIDGGGAGEPEVLTIRGNPILGGTYVVEVAETPDLANTNPQSFDAVGYTVDWTLKFQFKAGSAKRTEAILDVIDGQDDSTPQSVPIAWPVNVVSEITTEQHIKVYMEAIAFYEHPSKFNAVDEWLYWNDVEYFISPAGDGTLVVERLTPAGDRVTEFVIGDMGVQETEPVNEGPDLVDEVDPPFDIAAETIGYASAFLLVISMLTGGAFGNWSRKFQQIILYRRAKKRVAFHNVVSYGVILAATVHMVLFLWEPKYDWSVGFFLGGVSIFGMFLSGFTGAYQRPMVRSMGHEAWRWMHYFSFVLAFGGAVAHVLLDGIHFLEFQDMLGWEDPVAPALNELIPPSDP